MNADTLTPIECAVWTAAFGAAVADFQIHHRDLGCDEYPEAKRIADHAVWLLRNKGDRRWAPPEREQ